MKTGLKAVVAVKTADVIYQRILDRQAAHGGPYGHRAQQPPVQQSTGVPPAVSPGAGAAVVDQLARLGELRANGVLTDAEFEAGKARVLNV